MVDDIVVVDADVSIELPDWYRDRRKSDSNLFHCDFEPFLLFLLFLLSPSSLDLTIN